jgi:hypothetical protein
MPPNGPATEPEAEPSDCPPKQWDPRGISLGRCAPGLKTGSMLLHQASISPCLLVERALAGSVIQGRGVAREKFSWAVGCCSALAVWKPRYLRIATAKICGTTSPLDLLPQPGLTAYRPPPSIPITSDWRATAWASRSRWRRFRRYGECNGLETAGSVSLTQRRVMTAISSAGPPRLAARGAV